MLLFNQMLKLASFSSKISNLKQFKNNFEKWSNVFKKYWVWNYYGMKTGSIRSPTKSSEADSSVELFSSKLFKKTSFKIFGAETKFNIDEKTDKRWIIRCWKKGIVNLFKRYVFDLSKSVKVYKSTLKSIYTHR